MNLYKGEEMKKKILISMIIGAVFAMADSTVVDYGDTTYGSSDTKVHYDTAGTTDAQSATSTNHPNNDLYPTDEER